MSDARRTAEAWLEIYDATGHAGEACAAQLLRALLAEPAPGVTESARLTEEQWRYLASAEAQTRTEQAAVRRERAEVERLRALLAETAEPAPFPPTLVREATEEAKAWLSAPYSNHGPQAIVDARQIMFRLLAVIHERPAPAPSGAVREAWMDSARQFARNEAYYRGLIETALKDVPDAYLCDDGTRSEDVLCAKLPDIVAALLAPSPPAVDAVREAAERLRHSLTPPRSTTDDGMLLVRAEDVEAVLRALSSPAAPAKDEVREAAETLTVYCDVCQADRREPCHTVTTGDPAPYPHPERSVAAKLAARGGE